jgi:hypothetical protein
VSDRFPLVVAGEVDGLYSVADESEGQFLQLDKTDASAIAAGSPSDLSEFYSVEVVNGVGYAIGVMLGARKTTT